MARATNGNTQIDGNPITTYNITGRRDIVIFSTTCEGTYRWSRVIGGGGNDDAFNIEVDANGGVLVLVRVQNSAGGPNNIAQTHFSEDDMLPAPPVWNGVDDFTYHDAYRTGFLLRYHSDNGDLVWRKNIQTSAPHYIRNTVLPTQIQLDSSGTLHVILRLLEGTHLEGTVTVAADEMKYYVAKFNALTGNLAAPAVELPITGELRENISHFRYDEDLNRYYISSTRNGYYYNEGFIPFSYNGIPMEKGSFVLALDATTYNELWRVETDTNEEYKTCSIDELQIDAESNVYISGRYINRFDTPGVYLGTHQINNDVVTGESIYVAKLNPQGQVLWSKTPDSYTISNTALDRPKLNGIAFNGNQVIVAGSGQAENWGNGFSINKPFGHRKDPFLLHLNKETGATVGLNPVLGSFGAEHGFTKVAVDNDGNYVVGGYTHGNLFSADDDNVPTLYIQSSSYTDFLYAKFAATPCGIPVSSTKHNKLHLNVYPNPTHDILNIQTDEILQSYQVYNMLGQEVSKGTFTSGNATLSVAKLASGTYVVKVKTQNNTEATFKVVKK